MLQAFIRSFQDIIENNITVFFRRKALFCREHRDRPYTLRHLIDECEEISEKVDILHMAAVLVLEDLDGLSDSMVTSRVISRVLATIEPVQEKFKKLRNIFGNMNNINFGYRWRL